MPFSSLLSASSSFCKAFTSSSFPFTRRAAFREDSNSSRFFSNASTTFREEDIASSSLSVNSVSGDSSFPPL